MGALASERRPKRASLVPPGQDQEGCHLGDGGDWERRASPGRGHGSIRDQIIDARCRARATCEPGSPVAQGDDAKPGGGCRGRQPEVGESRARTRRRGGRHRAMGIARRIEASMRRRQLAEQAGQGPQGASPVIGTGGTSGCEASAPQVGHQRPSTQRHPASQRTAKRPESSHTTPKPRACQGLVGSLGLVSSGQ